MERFFTEKNLEHYRQLASGSLSGAERRTVFTSLSEDEWKYRELPGPAPVAQPAMGIENQVVAWLVPPLMVPIILVLMFWAVASMTR